MLKLASRTKDVVGKIAVYSDSDCYSQFFVDIFFKSELIIQLSLNLKKCFLSKN